VNGAPPAFPAPEPPADRIWFSERSTLGVQFTEHMSGAVGKPVKDRDRRAACARAIEPGASTESMSCTLTIIAADLEEMLRGRRHLGRVVGTVAINGGEPMAVRHGKFHLFVVRRDRVETRRIVYRMRVRPPGQQSDWFIEGYKEIRNSSPHHAWPDLTTLYVTISAGGYGREDQILWLGILRLSLGDFFKQLWTVRVRDGQRLVERLDGTARFVGFFAQILLGTYGRALAPSRVAVADGPPPMASARRWTADQPVTSVATSDGVAIRLTRYSGGARGPVLLVPGFTTVAASFDTPTVRRNLVQFLRDEGFDVWLLDYRASPAFEPAWSQFTIDDIARRDYPQAVRKVCEVTKSRQIQIVAHCVGSISLFMSLLSGELDGLVRSVVASQVSAYVRVARFTEAKAGLYLGSLLRFLGVKHISASFNPRRWSDWTIDQFLKLYPTKERCSNPVCRRLLFIFHEIYRHTNLNSETHDAIYEWFGVSSMSALKHLSLMVRTGHVVDAEGQEVYLHCDDPVRHEASLDRLEIPISFMYGKHNGAFLPTATRTLYEELCGRYGPDRYEWREFEDYGHFDCFIGREADQIIFPWIRDQLVRWTPAS